VSYDRNRKSIKDQAKEIATLKANAKNLSAKTSKLESTVKTVDQQVSEISRLKLGESLASVKAELKKTSEQITALSNQVKPYLPKLENYQVNIDSNTRQIKELNDELIRSVTDLQIQLNDNSLDKEVDKLSKLIASIDKNRTRVNAELVQLSKKVNELQKKMAGTK
jgi:chromosome segregation ATPase